MSDASPVEPPTDEAARKEPERASMASSSQSLIVDVGPLVVFVVAYNVANRFAKENAVFIATGAFMAATALAIGWSWMRKRSIPPMLIVTGVLVGLFGGLTLALRDPVFIKIKPTVINLLYATAILGGLAFRVNVWKLLFAGSFTLPDRIWNLLAVRWSLWFIALAAINELVWRNFSEEFWANFKLIGVMPLTILFALANVPVTMRHLGKTD